MYSKAILLAASLTVASALASTQEPLTADQPPILTKALWDGKCFYPQPDSTNFNLTSYLGRWYQVAGTFAPFTAGCTCIFAEYALNENGTVNVFNACQRGQRPSNITGIATPVDRAYGESGAFKVKFPFGSGDACDGPNYIVQDYSYDGKWAIVQASNFSTLFLLSRDQNPPSSSIDIWLERAGKRGSNINEIIRINQTNCLNTY